MKNSAWDVLAAAVEKSRTGDMVLFHWPDYLSRTHTVYVEWNGGLPAFSVDAISPEVFHASLTAFQVLDMIEGIE